MPPGPTPAVVTIHDVVPLDHPASVPDPLRRLLYRRVLARALRRAGRVIVPSTLTRDRLVDHGVAPEQLTVVPLGIGPRFRPLDGAEREQARRDFGGGGPYVVASSGPRAHKNLLGMGAAAACLNPGVPVVLTGGRPQGAGTERLRFVGRLTDGQLARFYGGAELMVLPALVEGFGLPALEALACGVPVVCGPQTGALDVLAPGALVVDVTRPAELAGAIDALLADGDSRTQLATSGRAAAEKLTAEAMAHATLAVYREVLARRSDAATR